MLCISESIPCVFFQYPFDMILLCPSLAILGNSTEFEKGVLWLSENLTFDIDARVNLFEVGV